jgi:pimeloyl-ACP methyl ester carboxylesterase
VAGLIAAGERLATGDGFALVTRRWPCEDAVAVAVLVHGFSASASDDNVVRQAEALNRARFEVVSYDARGHGGSEGTCTLGDLERHDVAAGVDLARRLDLPVVVIGASMGAIAALRYAADDSARIDGVVAISPPASWRMPRSLQGVVATAMTQTRLGRALARRHLRVRMSPTWTDPEAPLTQVRRITVPVALVHGTADRFIPPANSVALFRNCNEPRRLDLVPGMGHAFDEMAVCPVVAAAEWVLGGR